MCETHDNNSAVQDFGIKLLERDLDKNQAMNLFSILNTLLHFIHDGFVVTVQTQTNS